MTLGNNIWSNNMIDLFNVVYPIAKVEEIDIFNKRANEVMESWFIDSINNGTVTIR